MKKSWIVIAVCSAALIVGIVCVGVFLCLNVRIEGKLYRRDTTSLDLSGSELSNLSSVAKLSALKSLDISDCKIYDLSPLYACQSLEYVNAVGCELTTEQADAFFAALPECKLVWSVPIGQTRVNSDVDAIELVITEGDTKLLRYFDKLAAADFTGSRCYSEMEQAARDYQNVAFTWSVYIDDAEFAIDAVSASFSDVGYDELNQALSHIPKLCFADVTQCPLSLWEVDELTASFPRIEFLYTISELDCVSDCTQLTLTGELVSDLVALLPRLTKLVSVDLFGADVKADTLYELVTAFPKIDFEYRVPLGGIWLDMTTAALEVPKTCEAEELELALTLLPNLKDVDLTACGFTDELCFSLCDRYPAVHFSFVFSRGGVAWDTSAQDMDISSIQLENDLAIRGALPYMYALTRLVMCDCGLDDAVMEALGFDFPAVRFVWTVKLGPHELRTDAVAFSTFNRSKHISAVDSPELAAEKKRTYRLTTEDIQALRHCVDLEALDLGHNNIDDISVLMNCPKLQYLIVADNFLSDVSVVSQLHELIYVEMFMNEISDLTPFSKLEHLLDLNLCVNSISDFSPLFGLDTLERLWYLDNPIPEGHEQEIDAALPNCHCTCHSDGCTGSGWREHERYFEMRAIFLASKDS